MTIDEFENLDEPSKLAIMEEGAFLDFLSLSGNYYLLYSLGSFYIELEFSNDQEDGSTIRAFKDVRTLSKYYNRVELPKLEGI